MMDIDEAGPSVPSGEAKDLPDKNEKIIKNDTSIENPYAYLECNGFTAEVFKIEIRNLPKYYGIGELKKLLIKLKLECSKVKTIRQNSQWAFACFRSEADKQKALEVLQNFKWKGATLSARVANPAPDPLIQRRNEIRQGKLSKINFKTPEEQDEAIKNSVSPLWNLPYPEQTKQKIFKAESLLRKLGTELKKMNPAAGSWLESQKAKSKGLPCQLHPIKTMDPDRIDGYRNKCEFTIGRNELTGEKTIGFRLSTYASGSVGVAPVTNVRIVHPKMLEAVNVFEKYVRGSDLDVFAPDTWSGHWKQLTVRLGLRTGHVMLIIYFHPHKLESNDLDKIKLDLKQFFTVGDGALLKPTSVYIQIVKKIKPDSRSLDPELLVGESCINEVLCGLKFKISPNSFFQTNTECNEKLIESVEELAKLTPSTSLIDICCGTGTIGLSLAKSCGEVLGIELLEPAVMDARENAKVNNISNADFFSGRADDLIQAVVSRAKGESVVAVLDPPRAGLHSKAINHLRRIKKLEKIVFLSCNPELAFKNLIDLGRAESRSLVGEPFLPVAAMPVDMFPHTNHFELVFYFERQGLIEKRLKGTAENDSTVVQDCQLSSSTASLQSQEVTSSCLVSP